MLISIRNSLIFFGRCLKLIFLAQLLGYISHAWCLNQLAPPVSLLATAQYISFSYSKTLLFYYFNELKIKYIRWKNYIFGQKFRLSPSHFRKISSALDARFFSYFNKEKYFRRYFSSKSELRIIVSIT